MPVVYKDGQPYGSCGQITWYCMYDSTDPNCCQYEDILKRREKENKIKHEWDEETRWDLTKEYGARNEELMK